MDHVKELNHDQIWNCKFWHIFAISGIVVRTLESNLVKKMDHFGEFVSVLAVKIAPRLFGQTIEMLALVILVRTLVGILVRKWTTSGNSLDCKCALAVTIGHKLLCQKIEILDIVILVRTLESNLVRKWTTSGNYNHVKVGTNCTYYTVSPVHVLFSRFYLDFIQILSWFYPSFI